MNAIITLTTDFGITDAYVAVIKGVMLSINPQAKLVDICHTIQPQNIRQAGFILSTAYLFFPPKTIHLVVVDPGVGTERRAIILRTPAADFIAPDNGVLSQVIMSFTSPAGATLTDRQIKPGPEVAAVSITNPQFWRSQVSPTFHGRDIFAPVAAHLSLGVPLTDFGEAVTSVTMLPLAYPHRASDGRLVGQIQHIDNFGNLVTNIKRDDLPEPGETITIEVGNHVISGLSRTYAEGKGLLALIGSSDYLEVSFKGGSARAWLDAEIGDEVRVRIEGRR